MIQIFNSINNKKEEFKPIDSNHVRMYVCGPTVYNDIHIGNARPIIVFDTFFRLLKEVYPKVSYARNITDIDDKIIKAAKEKNISIKELTEGTTESFHSDIKHLNALNPTFEPKATDYIKHMQNMILSLIEKKHAYVENNHVFFDIASFESYGSLSGMNQNDILSGVRIDTEDYKTHKSNFVLWKPSKDDEPGWESPWGFGRPGWHIECSAMSKELLGNSFDIHGGGRDLIFPHHENERAQSICCNGGSFSNYWMHNNFILINGQKMSKSLNNFLTVKEALKENHGEVIRLAILTTHYRQTLDFSNEIVEQSKKTLNKFYEILEEFKDTPYQEPDNKEELLKELKNDLNTAGAIALLHSLFKDLKSSKNIAIRNQIIYLSSILGILQHNPESWLNNNTSSSLSEIEINELIKQRSLAKSEKNFQLSDKIRDTLINSNIEIKDTPNGTIWKYKK